MTSHWRETAISMRKAGHSTYRIAEVVGKSRSAIRMALDPEGHAERRRKNRIMKRKNTQLHSAGAIDPHITRRPRRLIADAETIRAAARAFAASGSSMSVSALMALITVTG